MKKYCVSLELAKEMKALGFEQESEFYWTPDPLNRKLDKNNNQLLYNTIAWKDSRLSAYTVGELGDMLPTGFIFNGEPQQFCLWKINDGWYVSYRNSDNEANISKGDKKLSDCFAKMLIYLKEEGII